MAGFRIEGNTSGNVVEVDSSNQLKVNLPATNTLAGFGQITSYRGTNNYHDLNISDEGQAYVAQQYQLLDLNFNSANTNWSPKIGTNATTMTKSPTSGFMRLNATSLSSTGTGISVYSNRPIILEEGAELGVRMYAKTVNASATNKQAELGLGYYNFAAGQANAVNEFIGFRWTTTGGLLGVVATSFGGAPTEQTIQINSNVPYSDNVTREYELLITESEVVFFVAGVYQGIIAKDPASWGLLKAISLPFFARVFNSGVASAGMNLDIGAVSIYRAGSNDNVPVSGVQAGMDSSTYYFQSDLQTTSISPHSWPASGSAPTAAAGSNTTSAANNVSILGGLIRNSLTAITTVVSTNIMWTAYQNPAYPTASGQATNARNLNISQINISPPVVTTALTGGPIVAVWFAAIGNTAISLATTDADGTTAVAQKAPRLVPLSLVSTISSNATVGSVATDVGDHQFRFPTPLVVHPGEFLSVGFRTLAVTTNVSQGSADVMIGVNGYWD